MIRFKPFKNILMTSYDQQKIINMFYYLQFPNSFVTNIQKLYNNSLHFSTVSCEYDLCTDNQLSQLVQKANSQSDEIIVEGIRHSNIHASYIIRNLYTNQPEICKDTYIRIRDPLSMRCYHIITNIPEIRHPYVSIVPNPLYQTPSQIIYPKPTLL